MRKIITAITTAVVINKMVNCMTKNEPGVELNIGFRIFRIVVWITATTGCLALMAWLVAFAWAEIREALQKPCLILCPENFCLLHKLNFCANDCSGYF